jgi:NAD(P)-dependent dehydrogenase (short-subunit alcohol dehydrogenase family)
MKEIAGKTAFITGAASGIGLGVGKALAQHGARVMLSDIDPATLAKAAADFPGEVGTVVLDVRDRDQWRAAREATEARFGPVSVLVNNAGIMNEGSSANYKQHNLFNQSPESFDRMIAINLVGVFNGIHEFAAGMAERGEGHIVNTSSSQGLISCGGVGAYCAAKFGVVGMSEALQQELADHGVGVSVLCPGVTQTNLPNSTNRLVGLPEVEMPEGFGMPTAIVGQQVVDAILANELYIVTHGEYIVPIAQRHARILAAAAKMPISPIYDPHMPMPGTPEFAAFVANGGNPAGEA